MFWMQYIRISFFILTIVYLFIYFNIDLVRKKDLKNALRFFLLGLAWCTGSFGFSSELKVPLMSESLIALIPFFITSIVLFVKVVKIKMFK